MNNSALLCTFFTDDTLWVLCQGKQKPLETQNHRDDGKKERIEKKGKSVIFLGETQFNDRYS